MNKWLISLMLVFLFIPFVSSASSYTFAQNAKTDLKVSCFDTNNEFCTTNTACQLSVNNPDMTPLVTNVSMTRINQTYFNYTFVAAKLSQLGNYDAVMICRDATVGFTKFSFDVTPTGQSGLLGFMILIILFPFIILAFGLYKEDIAITVLSTFMLYFLGLYILFYGIDIYKTNLTNAFALIILGVAGYASIQIGLEYLKGSDG